MKTILNSISQLSSIVFAVGIVYLILEATIGKIKKINHKKALLGVDVKDYIFLVAAIFIVIYFFDTIKPY